MSRPKRARGTGSISTRPRADGRYEARLTLPDGRRRSFYGETFEDAERKLAEARGRIAATGTLPDPGRMTVADLAALWFAWQRVSLAPGTVVARRSRYEHHVAPVIGRVRLAKLGTPHIQLVLTTAHERGLAASTLRELRALLAGLCAHGVRLDVMTRNPVDGVRVAAARPPDVPTLNADDLQRLVTACGATAYGPALITMLTVGLRWGEARALRWQDFDAMNGTIRVRHGIRVEHGEIAFGPLKTASSRRTIPLPDRLVTLIRTHRTEQVEARLRSPQWHDLDLIFPRPEGLPMARMTLAETLHRACRAAGVPRLTLHDLRRLCATQLAVIGVPVGVAMQLLGHSDSRTTIEVYQRVSPAMVRDAVSRIDDLLAGDG